MRALRVSSAMIFSSMASTATVSFVKSVEMAAHGTRITGCPCHGGCGAWCGAGEEEPRLRTGLPWLLDVPDALPRQLLDVLCRR